VAALGGALAVVAAASHLGVVDQHLVRIAGVPAAHGALLTMALAGADPRWKRHAGVLIALLAVAAAAAQWSPWGALVYVAVPLVLARIAARQARLAVVGLCLPASWPLTILGAAAGTLLGAHLLLSASRTLGYEVRVESLGGYLAAVAYDLGANVPSAECFFRGVLFNRAQRSWSFGAAAAVATGAYLLRYLADPALPRSAETIAGAMFYLTLLSLASCGLFWRSGSVLPGGLAALGFFVFYRALHGWW